MLDPAPDLNYALPAVAAAAARRGNRLNCKARSALNRRFFCGRFSYLYGGWRGETFGLAGVLAGRLFHPRDPSAALIVENDAADSKPARSLS